MITDMSVINKLRVSFSSDRQWICRGGGVEMQGFKVRSDISSHGVVSYSRKQRPDQGFFP